MKKKRTEMIPFRGLLIHLSHYDPVWNKRKSIEKPFDLELGLEIVDAMAKAGLNLLIIDCADGVKYKSHPELKRHYTVPMSYLEKIVRRAKSKGIDIIPKLNFSQSDGHKHNHWFRPHNELFDCKDYWKKAFEIIDELIRVCKPKRFFHVGMDEDHSRAYSQYSQAIIKLRNGLKKRNLRTVIWNDSSACTYPSAIIHAEKSLAAEKVIPRDIVQVVWNYGKTEPDVIRRLIKRRFDVWAAPGPSIGHAVDCKEIVLDCKGKGILLTRWIPCRPKNRKELLNLIKTVGPVCK